MSPLRPMRNPAPARRPPRAPSTRPGTRPIRPRARRKVTPLRAGARGRRRVRAAGADAAVTAAAEAEGTNPPAARVPTRPEILPAPDDIVKARGIAVVCLTLLFGPGLAGATAQARAAADSTRPAADLLVTNAKIFTGDPARPECESVG